MKDRNEKIEDIIRNLNCEMENLVSCAEDLENIRCKAEGEKLRSLAAGIENTMLRLNSKL